MDKHELAQQFQEYFRPEVAVSPSMKERTFRLRYEVYCREFGFEQEEDCPGGLERDEYDATARHCALIHKPTGMSAGTVRLIRSAPSHGALGLLPLQRFCDDSLDHPALHPALMPQAECCEISRLAVPQAFRRRAGERYTPWGAAPGATFSEREMRTFPLIAVSLFLAAAALVAMNCRPHVFVMMEPRLARMLSGTGLRFVQIGRLTHYHGSRAGFYIRHEQTAVDAMRPEFKALYDDILQTLSGAPANTPAPAAVHPEVRASARSLPWPAL
ncbi:PEP-CTERM/exosortase system-associated acyltransferase [Aquisalimonas sp.]|uniref:PEP-CTERM/exosortase system-associated acyltransferase n=1 Tax=Aquisalimonas sp. TaxID=1872621 RepID=UPI0025BFEBAD|nr:PEP-CTERM/exosortase system-associated acyltransferase [Aquisalimonas sp.]